MPVDKEDVPGTIERSPKKVQDTYEKTLDSAHEQYDSEERAHRTAWAAVKHVAEKKGDHWELKDEPGPSDPQSKQSGRAGARPPQGDVRRRRRRGQHEGRALRAREEARHRGPLEHDQGGAGRGDRQAPVTPRPYGTQVSPAGVTISSCV